ncbi:hypothetical protein ACWGQ5_42315 [Streptomyces sp. NPDC055722]
MAAELHLIYDFTHFTAAKRCALAIMHLVSRTWLATLVSAEESSVQVEVTFTGFLRGCPGLQDSVGKPANW